MLLPENSAAPLLPNGNDALKNAEQLALQQAENAIAEKSEKLRKDIEIAQKAVQAAQAAKALAGGFRNTAPLSNNLPQQTFVPVEPLPGFEKTNEAMEAIDIAGIIHVTTLTIVIGTNVYKHFESFNLQQSTTDHHTFRLVLQQDVTGTVQDHTMEDVRKFLGSRISVTFRYKNFLRDSPEREFIGIIGQVGFIQKQGGHSSIVLTGQSPTMLLDAAPHTQSFGGEDPTSLYHIAHQVIKQGLGSSRFDVFVKPVFRNNLVYSCQYNESHHNYLSRMAAAYGEWYYYDGRVLYFGKPPFADPITLIFGKDTTEVDVQMKAAHISRSHYGYNSSDNSQLAAGPTNLRGLGELGSFANETSKKVFITPSVTVSPIRAALSMDVASSQAGANGAAAAGMFIVSGKTTVPFLNPGCLIEMNFRKPGSSDVRYFSRMIVTDISHSLDAKGNYEGFFKAIPSDMGYLPEPKFTMPIAQPQLATVKDNKDAQGRIRVQFDWQQYHDDTTDFIRMMSPDAGSSDKVSTNRGFMAIPEVGDQVMVGFVHNNPDRPFAMGGMFHGKVGGGGGSGNNVKSLSSKSGHTITLNDSGGITIKDKAGNLIELDGTGKISSTANEEICITTGAASITLKKSGEIAINGSQITIDGTTFVKASSSAAFIQLTADGKADLSAQITTITGTETAVVTAPDTTVNGDNKTGVKSGGPTSIEGAIVKLN